MGEDYRKSLKILSKYISFKNHKYRTNLKVFDWTVPKEWRIKKAYIKHNGKKILDFEKELDGIDQATSGRIGTSKMWNPRLLDVVYNYYEDRINKFCFENKKILSAREINLKSVFP